MTVATVRVKTGLTCREAEHVTGGRTGTRVLGYPSTREKRGLSNRQTKATVQNPRSTLSRYLGILGHNDTACESSLQVKATMAGSNISGRCRDSDSFCACHS
eukprot:1934733-Rhodomonas_salina.1